MYSTHACPYCRLADRLLVKKGVTIEKVLVDESPERRIEMTRITGRVTVPQIFINGIHVGGYTELAQLDLSGRLDIMLQHNLGETHGAGD